MRKYIVCALVMLQLAIQPAWAQTRDYNALRKLARGAANVTLSWVEIPRQIMHVTDPDETEPTTHDVAGVFWGPVKGFAFFLGRMALGTYELVTFLVPPYRPLVEPEFVISEEEGE